MPKRSVYGTPTVANDPSVAAEHLIRTLPPAVLQLIAELAASVGRSYSTTAQ